MGVHHRLVLGTPVAEVMVELLQRRFVVASIALEGDGEVFVGMGVVERKGAGLIRRGRIMDGACAGNQQQRGEAETASGFRQRQ